MSCAAPPPFLRRKGESGMCCSFLLGRCSAAPVLAQENSSPPKKTNPYPQEAEGSAACSNQQHPSTTCSMQHYGMQSGNMMVEKLSAALTLRVVKLYLHTSAFRSQMWSLCCTIEVAAVLALCVSAANPRRHGGWVGQEGRQQGL